MKSLLSTKEVAQLLNIHEKMVYTLVGEKGLPATKVTGKWLFPNHLVEQWIESNTINYPSLDVKTPGNHALLIIAGSNDPLLDKTIALFNSHYPEQLTVFGNVGSMGGLRSLNRNLCHIASSHLLQENEDDYNFEYASSELDSTPAIVNFCRREQGLLVRKGNPQQISGIKDLVREDIKIVNRPLGTGTRLLLDRELRGEGLESNRIKGYDHVVSRHLDVGIELLSGRADVGPGIRAVAGLLNIDFIPLRWERYDFMIARHRFFDKAVQMFITLLHDEKFYDLSDTLDGYDVKLSGKMVFPGVN